MKVLLTYNLPRFKCGDTYYYNHQESPTGDELLIGIAPIDSVITSVLDSTMDLTGSDMKIIGLIIPQEIIIGEPFDVKVIVKNMGDEKGSDQITVSLPDGWETDREYMIVMLSPGETTSFIISVTPSENNGEIAVGSSTDFQISGLLEPKEKGESTISKIKMTALIIAHNISQNISQIITSIDLNGFMVMSMEASVLVVSFIGEKKLSFKLKSPKSSKKGKPWKNSYRH